MNFDVFGESEEERLFRRALELPAEDRETYLTEQTSGQTELRHAVLQLLAGHRYETGQGLPLPGDPATDRGGDVIEEEEQPGSVIRRYTLCRKLGSGGMGTVWLAEQREPVKRYVALKLIKLGMDTRELVRRFERERQTLARLQHPHIAQVYDAGATASGRPFFVMEYVDGVPLTDWCDRKQLGLRERLDLFRDICAAVDHAHTKGVIHRDLKPSNILVDESGQAKVIDFGIAKATANDSDEDFTLTQGVRVMGTPAYMSPEQAIGDPLGIDVRTDIYSLGAILYELLTGHPPFEHKRLSTVSVAELQRVLREETPAKPSRQAATTSSADAASRPLSRSELRGDLDWITLKALDKDLDRRYRSAALFAEDIGRFLAGRVVHAVPPSRLYRSRKFVHRHRVLVAALSAVFLALAFGLGMSLRQTLRANRAQAAATATLASMQAASASQAVGQGEHREASLLFAAAAKTAEEDPHQRRLHRLRATSYHDADIQVARAVEIPLPAAETLQWHPNGRALLAGFRETFVLVDLETEDLWTLPSGAELGVAAWHPNGRLLASRVGSRVRVYGYPSGNLVREFDSSNVGFRWSPDGKWLALASNVPALWNVEADELRRGTPALACHYLNWSPTSQALLLESSHGASVAMLDPFLELQFPPVPVSKTGWLEGDFLDTVGRQFFINGSEAIEVRNSHDGRVLKTVPYPKDSIDESLGIATGTNHKGHIVRRGMRLYNFYGEEGSEPMPFPDQANFHQTYAFHPDGRHFLTGTKNARLLQWDLLTGQSKELARTFGNASALAFSADRTFLASAERNLVRVWAPVPDPPRVVRETADTTICELADGAYMREGGLQVRQIVTEAQWFDLKTHEALGPAYQAGGAILDALMGPDRNWSAIAVSSIGRTKPETREQRIPGEVRLFDPSTGKMIGEWVSFEVEPRALALHPSGTTLGVFCGDGSGWELDLVDGGPPVKRALWPGGDYINPNSSQIDSLCRYSDDGKQFIVYSLQSNFRIWDRASKRTLREIDGPRLCYDVDIHEHVACIPVTGTANFLEFVDVRTGEPLRKPIGLPGAPLDVEFSPQGDVVMVALNNKSVQVWDWRAGEKLGPDLIHSENLGAACFIPGDEAPSDEPLGEELWVATSSDDLHLHMWDVRSGQKLRPPLRMGGGAVQLEVSTDQGTLVASGYLNGQTYFFDLERALPRSAREPDTLIRLGEINAQARLKGGGISRSTREQWLEAWRAFRVRHPDFPGHRLPGE